jgi:hypothetical protein
MIVDRQSDLLEIVLALGTAARFPRGLNRGEQERHENANDRNDDQQLDEGECASLRAKEN